MKTVRKSSIASCCPPQLRDRRVSLRAGSVHRGVDEKSTVYPVPAGSSGRGDGRGVAVEIVLFGSTSMILLAVFAT